MRRLGLVWRVTLIVIAALVAIQMIAAAAYYVQRGRATEQGFRLPLPDQMAALVELVERAGNRSLALRVANGPGLRVAIAHTAPPVAEPVERVAWLENAIARYIGDGRMVRAYYIGPARGGESKRRPALENFSQRPVRLVLPLSDGEFMVAETVDDLSVRVLGLPPGFWAGIIGFLVAALALYAVVRETIPLSRLALQRRWSPRRFRCAARARSARSSARSIACSRASRSSCAIAPSCWRRSRMICAPI
jgi:two-component system osmolarity sensor histidine kinase EnvZ